MPSIRVNKYPLEDAAGTLISDQSQELLRLVHYNNGEISASWPTELSVSDFFEKLTNPAYIDRELEVEEATGRETVRSNDLRHFLGHKSLTPHTVSLTDKASGIRFGWQLDVTDVSKTKGELTVQQNQSFPLLFLQHALQETGAGSLPPQSFHIAEMLSRLIKD